MHIYRALLLAACCCAGMAGCLAHRVACDGIDLRQVLVDLYTEQAMDNLIRAVENRPFVQLAYSGLQVQDTDKASGNANSGEGDFAAGHTFDATKAGVLRLTHTAGFTGRFPFGLTGERDRILSFKADPVVEQNAIYDEYLSFARNPALFVVSDCKPDCPVHLCRKCGHKWYWVPVEAGADLLQLVMTTAINPPPVNNTTVYWDTAIASITPRLDSEGKVIPNLWVIALAKEVPNDDGVLVVSLKGGKVSLPIQKVGFMPISGDKKAAPPSPGPGDGVPIKTLYTQFSEAVLPRARLTELVGAPVQFFARDYPNLSPRPSTDNQRIEDSLESIRLLLNKTNALNP
jgi:hypothetical protein